MGYQYHMYEMPASLVVCNPLNVPNKPGLIMDAKHWMLNENFFCYHVHGE